MEERWRSPAQILAVEDDPHGIDYSTGRPTQGLKKRVHPETIARYKLGYLCIQCDEPHEVPFPNHCSLCRYPMAAQQQEDFARGFGGVQRDSRAVAIEQGLDRVDDTHERRFHTTKAGIIVP